MVVAGRQDGDVAGHLAQAEILDQHLAELRQRHLLVGAVHGCARIDHVAQRRVVVLVHGRMLDQHLQDGRHGEQVRHPMALDQPEGLVHVEAVGRQQDRRRTARHDVELVDAGPVRQGGHDQGGVFLRRSRHEVAQVIVDDERHLAMRQHRRLGPARRARGEEEPAGIVMLDRRRRRLSALVLVDQGADIGVAEGRPVRQGG